jgi:hypothetical protein
MAGHCDWGNLSSSSIDHDLNPCEHAISIPSVQLPIDCKYADGNVSKKSQSVRKTLTHDTVDTTDHHTRTCVHLRRHIGQRRPHPREMVDETAAVHSKNAPLLCVRRRDMHDRCIYISGLVNLWLLHIIYHFENCPRCCLE